MGHNYICITDNIYKKILNIKLLNQYGINSKLITPEDERTFILENLKTKDSIPNLSNYLWRATIFDHNDYIETLEYILVYQDKKIFCVDCSNLLEIPEDESDNSRYIQDTVIPIDLITYRNSPTYNFKVGQSGVYLHGTFLKDYLEGNKELFLENDFGYKHENHNMVKSIVAEIKTNIIVKRLN